MALSFDDPRAGSECRPPLQAPPAAASRTRTGRAPHRAPTRPLDASLRLPVHVSARPPRQRTARAAPRGCRLHAQAAARPQPPRRLASDRGSGALAHCTGGPHERAGPPAGAGAGLMRRLGRLRRVAAVQGRQRSARLAAGDGGRGAETRGGLGGGGRRRFNRHQRPAGPHARSVLGRASKRHSHYSVTGATRPKKESAACDLCSAPPHLAMRTTAAPGAVAWL